MASPNYQDPPGGHPDFAPHRGHAPTPGPSGQVRSPSPQAHHQIPPPPVYHPVNNHVQNPPVRPSFIPAQWPNQQPPPPPPAPVAPANPPLPPHPQNAQQPLFVLQNPPQQVRHMPGRYDRAAPRFDGHPRSLRRFFEEVEILSRDCRLGQRDLIAHTLRYLEANDYDTWTSQPSAFGDDWQRFKADIFALYPGAEDSARYTVTDLENFVENSAASPMQDRIQFGQYYRSFVTRSTFLLGRNLISTRERNKLFMTGFHIDFRNQLRHQLRIQNPIHPLDEPWDISTVERAARFLLEGTGIPDHSSSTPHIPLTSQSIPVAPAAPAPRQTFDMSSIEQILTSEAFLTRLAGKLIPQNHQPPPSSFSTSYAQNPPQRRYCAMCSDPGHVFRYCEVLNDYLRKGLCIKDPSNRICMPDGTLITPQIAPGRNMKERIDYWHQNCPTQPTVVQANLLEAIPVQQFAFNALETPSHPLSSSTISSPDPDHAELLRLEAIALANQKRQDEIRKRMGNAGKSRNAPEKPGQAPNRSKPSLSSPNTTSTIPSTYPPHNSSSSPQNTSGTSSAPHQPQYRYTTAIEDPKILKEVIDRSMDAQVTLSTRELCAVAPDIRKHFKEQVTPRRIPTSSPATSAVLENANFDDSSPSSTALVNHLSSPPNPLIVANNIEDLRIISLELDGKLAVDAILDEGSQIIAIKKEIWEQLGFPLLKKENMVMESANSTTEATLGLLRDLPVRIGPSTLYLQVQVVENAPYDMLLGRPFMTLTQSCTHHYNDGNSHLTLLDPNTHQSFTIPTKPRIRRPVLMNEGF